MRAILIHILMLFFTSRLIAAETSSVEEGKAAVSPEVSVGGSLNRVQDQPTNFLVQDATKFCAESEAIVFKSLSLWKRWNADFNASLDRERQKHVVRIEVREAFKSVVEKLEVRMAETEVIIDKVDALIGTLVQNSPAEKNLKALARYRAEEFALREQWSVLVVRYNGSTDPDTKAETKAAIEKLGEAYRIANGKKHEKQLAIFPVLESRFRRLDLVRYNLGVLMNGGELKDPGRVMFLGANEVEFRGFRRALVELQPLD